MPIAYAEQRIDFPPLGIRQSVTDLRCQNRLRYSRGYRGGTEIGFRQPLIVLKPHPHEIDRHKQAILAGLNRSHESEVEVGQNIASRDMYTCFVTENSGRAAEPWEPEIGRDHKVPFVVIVSGRHWRRWSRR